MKRDTELPMEKQRMALKILFPTFEDTTFEYLNRKLVQNINPPSYMIAEWSNATEQTVETVTRWLKYTTDALQSSENGMKHLVYGHHWSKVPRSPHALSSSSTGSTVVAIPTLDDKASYDGSQTTSEDDPDADGCESRDRFKTRLVQAHFPDDVSPVPPSGPRVPITRPKSREFVVDTPASFAHTAHDLKSLHVSSTAVLSKKAISRVDYDSVAEKSNRMCHSASCRTLRWPVAPQREAPSLSLVAAVSQPGVSEPPSSSQTPPRRPYKRREGKTHGRPPRDPSIPAKFKCPNPTCNRPYRSPNGVLYHLGTTACGDLYS